MMLLPPEILHQIFLHLHLTSTSQPTLHACTLVSRSWYQNAVSHLYDSPVINGKNYDLFVRAICPSVNAHIRTNGLAELVRTLDMSCLVHNGSKSLTARILGRVKGGLEGFVAPQASFAINCLAALSKCTHLRYLDLSLVSESITLPSLLHSTSHLPHLHTLHLPRSSTPDPGKSILTHSWPPQLQTLHISGGLHDETTVYFSTLPTTLSHLTIANCPYLTMLSIGPLLSAKGPQLQRLEIIAPIPRLKPEFFHTPLNSIMKSLPNLSHLKISVDFIDLTFFSGPNRDAPQASLSRIDLHCFDTERTSDTVDITASSMYLVAEFHPFSNVRIVGVHQKLGWVSDAPQDVFELDQLLKALAREDGPGGKVSEADAGVVVFGKGGNHPLHRL